MLNDNTWRISITKVHIIHVFSTVEGQIFCRRYDYMYITDKPDQPSIFVIWQQYTVKEHFNLLNDSKLLQFMFKKERRSLVVAIFKPFLSQNEIDF